MTNHATQARIVPWFGRNSASRAPATTVVFLLFGVFFGECVVFGCNIVLCYSLYIGYIFFGCECVVFGCIFVLCYSLLFGYIQQELKNHCP